MSSGTGNVYQRMPYFQAMFQYSAIPVFGLWLAMCCAIPTPIQGKDMEPSLGAIFPMEALGESVTTSYHVLLNKTVILPKDTILRCCFQMPEDNSADVRKKEKKNTLENTFSRKPIKVTNKDENYNPYREAVKDRAFQTVWSDPDLFRGYFYKVQSDRYFLVYHVPGADNPTFAQFFFPEGLFLVSDGEHVQVLSVQIESRGAAAGFKAGDRIHALEGLELKGDLNYLSVVKKNKLQSAGLEFSVIPKGSEEPTVREIKLPLSIHSDPFSPIGGR